MQFYYNFRHEAQIRQHRLVVTVESVFFVDVTGSEEHERIAQVQVQNIRRRPPVAQCGNVLLDWLFKRER